MADDDRMVALPFEHHGPGEFKFFDAKSLKDLVGEVGILQCIAGSIVHACDLYLPVELEAVFVDCLAQDAANLFYATGGGKYPEGKKQYRLGFKKPPFTHF